MNVLFTGIITASSGIVTTIVSELRIYVSAYGTAALLPPSVNFAIRLTNSGVATVSANTVPNVAPMAGILE